ncbi:PCYCGC motif-containing (lipo)protein [Alkalihalobacillus macyae]|nr:PCYCGC motif-containing (lipo)protein [Alkalihalobacillus macyae]
MYRIKMVVCVSLLALGVITGCGSEDHNEVHMVNGDIRETTASTDILPTFLDDKQTTVETIYAEVAQHKDLLEHIPCYCGCGESAGHTSSYDCFINAEDNNGITWDDHGAKCGVCMDIAAQSISWLNEGQSVKEIRERIDEAYKEGYGTPTPTPIPEV